MTIKCKKLDPKAILPARATAESAGFDLAACLEEPVLIPAGETRKIPIGVAVELPPGTAGMIYSRSGLSTRHGLAMINGVGVVDSDYRGGLVVPLHNFSKEDFTIRPGDRVAQLVVTPVLLPDLIEADELSDSERGTGGFGSTGLSAK
ncbi:MAG: dUTP diphosphatase [Oscillospiraceae bacterium]|nr:dUTP diphosphatase [Oscillospiraceae bacterium]